MILTTHGLTEIIKQFKEENGSIPDDDKLTQHPLVSQNASAINRRYSVGHFRKSAKKSGLRHEIKNVRF